MWGARAGDAQEYSLPREWGAEGVCRRGGKAGMCESPMYAAVQVTAGRAGLSGGCVTARQSRQRKALNGPRRWL